MSTVKANTYQDASGGSNAILYGAASPAGSMGFRNRIINGDMRIDQRNAGASVTANDGTYSVDRWVSIATANGKFSMQQNAGSVTPPAGFTNYLGCTSTAATSLGATDFYHVRQKIEGLNVSDLAWGTANAKTVTLSFWVRSSLTGTFGGSVNNSSFNRSYPFSYTISSANTWEQKSVTIAGDTTGTWLTTNGIGIQVSFSLGSGSTYSGTAGAWAGTVYTSATGATSVVGTNGATFYITGVQLEVGSVATEFERRPYGTELSLCQRYYVKYSSSGADNQAFLIGVVGSTTLGQICSTNFANPMRASPTGSYSGANTLRVFDGSGAPVVTSITDQYSSATTGSLSFGASGGGLTVGRAALIIPYGAPCYVDFSAEL